MKKFYITFGQIHTHSVNGKTFDKNSLCEIVSGNREEAHSKAMKIFNGAFHRCLTEDEIKEVIGFFPRGIIPLERNL